MAIFRQHVIYAPHRFYDFERFCERHHFNPLSFVAVFKLSDVDKPRTIWIIGDCSSAYDLILELREAGHIVMYPRWYQSQQLLLNLK